MTESDRKRFAVLMYWLARKYPVGRDPQGNDIPKKMTAEEINDYCNALFDLRIERLEWGAKYWYGHSKWFPKPAELREVAERAPASVVASLPDPREEHLLSRHTSEQEAQEERRKIRQLLASFYAEVDAKGQPPMSEREEEARSEELRRRVEGMRG